MGRGEDPKNPDFLRKTCRILLEGTINKQDNTIFFINYNKNVEAQKEGGSHWSVLLYRKKENQFFHHDPVNNVNTKYANMMAKKIKDIDSKISSTVIEIPCPQQGNGYDCGLYAILYIKKIVEKILKGISPNKYESGEINDNDANELRRNLYNQIMQELKVERKKGIESKNSGESKPKSDKNTKRQTHNKSMDDEDKNKNKLEECWHYTNRQCRYRENCDKLHKDICTDFKRTGICENKDFYLGHPDLCKRIQSDNRCNLF